MDKQSPKLRTVIKSVPAFPLNEFNKDFPYLLGKELKINSLYGSRMVRNLPLLKKFQKKP